MIYLIGGAPRVGKSTIAIEFAKQIKSRIFSTDELGSPHSNSSVIFYSDSEKNILTPNKRVKAIVNEAKRIIPRVDSVLDEAVKGSENNIIEGVHLFPFYVTSFIEKFGEKNIKAIFIGARNPGIILQGMMRNTSPNNWTKNCTQNVLNQITSFVKVFSDHLFDECKKYNLFYKERTANFQLDIHDIICTLRRP